MQELRINDFGGLKLQGWIKLPRKSNGKYMYFIFCKNAVQTVIIVFIFLHAPKIISFSFTFPLL